MKYYKDERLPLPKQSHKIETPKKGKRAYRRKGRRVEKNTKEPFKLGELCSEPTEEYLSFLIFYF